MLKKDIDTREIVEKILRKSKRARQSDMRLFVEFYKAIGMDVNIPFKDFMELLEKDNKKSLGDKQYRPMCSIERVRRELQSEIVELRDENTYNNRKKQECVYHKKYARK